MTLADYLKNTGMTHTAFASKIEVSPVTVYRWLSLRRFPARELIVKIEEATGGKVKPKDWYKQVPEYEQARLAQSKTRHEAIALGS